MKKIDDVTIRRGVKVVKVPPGNALITVPVWFLETLVKVFTCTMKTQKDGTVLLRVRDTGKPWRNDILEVKLIHVWKPAHVPGDRGRHSPGRTK